MSTGLGFFCLLILVVCATCASYTPSSAPIPRAETMTATRTEGFATAGADPCLDPARQKAVFDADMGKAGIVPIQLFVSNQGDRPLLIRPSDIVLEFPNGSGISPAGASAAAAQLESIGGIVASSIAFGIVGYLVSSSAEDKARAARLEDYKRKELQEATLRKDESKYGFVYFLPPPQTNPSLEATLKVRFVNVEDATSFVIPLPLQGLKIGEGSR